MFAVSLNSISFFVPQADGTPAPVCQSVVNFQSDLAGDACVRERLKKDCITKSMYKNRKLYETIDPRSIC